MRYIVLDTETTGLSPKAGHRLIEIGCLEVINRRITGETYHCYLNPERTIDEGAVQVHGLTADFLADKPLFRDVFESFQEFIADSTLIIHNASFDLGFLNHELKALNDQHTPLERQHEVIDTLRLARQLHPGQRNNLDALCGRYKINNSHRVKHGALLDAEILAEVYLAMTAGQKSFNLMAPTAIRESQTAPQRLQRTTLPLTVIKASATELQAHQEIISSFD